MNPLVSVLIPLFNASKYVEATLISVQTQTYANLEIIIVDDHSTDNSWEIVTKIAQVDERISVHKNIKKGASSARNYAFSLSSGIYIQYLDADDILHPDKIKDQIVTLLETNRDDVLVGCEWQRFSGKTSNLIGEKGPKIDPHKSCYNHKEWLIMRPDVPHIAWLLKREFILEAGGWDESLTRNDDGEFIYRVLEKNKMVVVNLKTQVFYRTELTPSLSKSLSEESVESWIKSALTYKSVLNAIAPLEGRIASDKFMYFLYYICILRYPNLAKRCYSELYFPKNTHEIGDNFVYKLAKLTNLKFAKSVRIFVNWLRGLENV